MYTNKIKVSVSNVKILSVYKSIYGTNNKNVILSGFVWLSVFLAGKNTHPVPVLENGLTDVDETFTDR